MRKPVVPAVILLLLFLALAFRWTKWETIDSQGPRKVSYRVDRWTGQGWTRTIRIVQSGFVVDEVPTLPASVEREISQVIKREEEADIIDNPLIRASAKLKAKEEADTIERRIIADEQPVIALRRNLTIAWIGAVCATILLFGISLRPRRQ